MKKIIFVLALTLAAAAKATLPGEKTLLAIGRSEGAGFGELKVKPEEAARAAAGLRDYLTIKDNFPAQEAAAKAHELIAARQDAAGGKDAPGQGTQEEWLAGLYAYGQETGMRLYPGAFSKEEAAVVARAFEEALCGRAPRVTAQESREISAFMDARAKKSAAAQAAFFEKMAREPGAVKTSSGGLFIPRKEGDGAAPKPYYWVKSVVAVKSWDGKPLEEDNGEKEMQLPEAGFITDALMKMKAGGKATLVTPPGSAGERMPVAVMELQLLSVREGTKPEEPAAPAEPQPAVEEPRPAAEPAADKTVEELTAEYNSTGDGALAYLIGEAYSKEQRGAALDLKKAFVWYSRAAAKKNAEGALSLGRAYDYGSGVPSNKTEAAKWYAKGSELGSTEATVAMAEAYRYGKGVKKDEREALKWYLKAADADNKVWKDIGHVYMFPDDASITDYAEALKWYSKAYEELGDSGAIFSIGNVYKLGGHGVAQDLEKGFEWYKKGAELGDSPSIQYLSEAYDRGEGTPANPAEAYKWYMVYTAKEPAREFEQNNLKRLGDKLTPAEKAAAQKEAQALIARLVTDKDREDKAYLESLQGK